MIVYAVYLMTVDGIELVSEKFQSQVTIPDTTLLSALVYENKSKKNVY